MKKSILSWLLLCFISISCFAQNPSQTDKLFYTCKVYGFVKHYHFRASTCRVNWDSVVVNNLPAVRAAVTQNEFNNVLAHMLMMAGPTSPPLVPLPDTLPTNAKRNRDWGWVNDPILRSDVSTALNEIKDNFLPHAGCWITSSRGSSNSMLLFPADTNYTLDRNAPLTSDINTFAFFKYWTVQNYLNPNKQWFNQTWETTFKQFILPIQNTRSKDELTNLFQKANANLTDPASYFSGIYRRNDNLYPATDLRYVAGKYVVTRQLGPMAIGTEIRKVNGMTPQQWEDSLKPYIPFGTDVQFRNFVKKLMLRTKLNSSIAITYADNTGAEQEYVAQGVHASLLEDDENVYTPADSLSQKSKVLFPCGIAYVNPARITPALVASVLDNVKKYPVIILDLRQTYDALNTVAVCASKLNPKPFNYAQIDIPNLTYPGTFNRVQAQRDTAFNAGYNGKVILLVDENSWNLREIQVMMLEQIPGVIKVGTKTAGSIGNTSMHYGIFKNEAFIFNSVTYYYPDGTPVERIGVGPSKPTDVLVTITPEGLKNNRDEILEAALKAAGCPLSTEEIKNVMNGTTLYPNPATNSFSIATNSKDAIVKIYSLTGQLMLQTTQVSNINIQHLPAGVYVVQVTAGSQTHTEKLVKE